MWGRICGHEIPAELPDEAVELLGAMHCELIDEEDIDASWLSTMTDSPYPGPVTADLQLLVNATQLPLNRQSRAYGLA